jgi:hypothetical protein
VNPIAFAVITFGIWIVVKGQAAAYWALATTANPSGALVPSGGATTAIGTSGQPAAATAPIAALSPFAQSFAPTPSPLFGK